MRRAPELAFICLGQALQAGSAVEQCVEGRTAHAGPTQQRGETQCEFRTVTAESWQRQPLDPDRWTMPVLVTGARQAGKSWSAPFNMLDDLVGGRYDGTVVALGPATSTSLFAGGAAGRSTLAAFRANMTGDAVVFDTQNSGAGRHTQLPIPGVPFVGFQ